MNIYCFNCEHECSEVAATCPECGHPLAEPTTSILSIRGHPKWVAATLAVGLAAGSIPFLTRERSPERLPVVGAAPLPTSTDAQAGFGWSLDDIKNLWGQQRGWTSVSEGPFDNGTGVVYTARLDGVQTLGYIATGPRDNIRSLTVVFTAADEDGAYDLITKMVTAAALLGTLSNWSVEDVSSWMTETVTTEDWGNEEHELRRYGQRLWLSGHATTGGLVIKAGVTADNE